MDRHQAAAAEQAAWRSSRRVLNGIFWVLRTGAPWRDLPTAFGPYTTCYRRFVRWRRAGVWGRIIEALATAHVAAAQMIDTSIVRVHQHGTCITSNQRQSMGRSRGGLTSKSMRWSMAMVCRYGWREATERGHGGRRVGRIKRHQKI